MINTINVCALIDWQVVEDGYEFFAKRQLVTLFSAPNYCGEFDNAGAMMSVDETLMCSFQVLRSHTDRQVQTTHTHTHTHTGRQVLCLITCLNPPALFHRIAEVSEDHAQESFLSTDQFQDGLSFDSHQYGPCVTGLMVITLWTDISDDYLAFLSS